MNAREHRLSRLRLVKTHLTVLTTPDTSEYQDLTPRVRFYLRLARWFVEQAFHTLVIAAVLPSKNDAPEKKKDEDRTR